MFGEMILSIISFFLDKFFIYGISLLDIVIL